MKITIDGIKYNLVEIVEQKVDQEREGVIADMEDIYYTGYCEGNRLGRLYDKGYRKVGEVVSLAELSIKAILPISVFKTGDVNVVLRSLLKHFDITKKVK